MTRATWADDPGQRGSVAILTVVVGVLAMIVVHGVAVVGAAAVTQARADAAADAAALAAADQIALGWGESVAHEAARTTASDNGAELTSCDCDGGEEVEVRISMPAPGLVGVGPRTVEASARAEIDWSAFR